MQTGEWVRAHDQESAVVDKRVRKAQHKVEALSVEGPGSKAEECALKSKTAAE